MRPVQPVDPSRVHIEKREDHVRHVGRGQDEDVIRHQEQAEIEHQVRPHRMRGSARLVDVGKIAGEPSLDRSLIGRSRGSRHRGHDAQQNRQDQEDGDHRFENDPAAENVSQHVPHIHTAADSRSNHAVDPERTLKGQRHQREDRDAQKARRHQGEKRIPGRISEFARVACRRLEAIGGPQGNEQGAADGDPAGLVPCPVDRLTGRVVGERDQRQEIPAGHIASEKRHDADQNERHERGYAKQHRHPRGLQDSAALDRETAEQQRRRDDERRVDAQRQPFLEPTEIRQDDLPACDGGIRSEKEVEHVAGAEARADRQHHGPRRPIAPYRDRREQFAIARPGDRAVDGGASGLAGKQPGDLGIGKGLDEGDHDGGHPHEP